MPDYQNDYLKAVRWAAEVIELPFPTFILDTETTGLERAGRTPQVVEISMIDLSGNVVVDTLIKCPNPEWLMEPGKGGLCAADIHGITPDMLDDAPSWEEIGPHLDILNGSELIIYNAMYDWPVIVNMNKMHFMTVWEDIKVTDAMEHYAAFCGEWNHKYGNYKWQKLPAIEGVQAHRALADCYSTLEVIKRMASNASRNE